MPLKPSPEFFITRWLKKLPQNEGTNLMLRLITGFTIGPFFFLSPWFSVSLFQVLLWLCALAAAREWVRMILPASWQKYLPYVYAVIILQAGLSLALSPAVSLAGTLIFSLIILVLPFQTFAERKWLALGLPYISGAVYAMTMIARQNDWGPLAIVFLLIGVMSGDIGAYFIGKAFGGPKLIPEISPKKTWSGFAGGLTFAVLFGWCFALVMDAPVPSETVFFMAILALLGQIGDLVESGIKRHHRIKDTGSVLPGHGGVLDRADGYLLAAPVFGIMLWIMQPALPW